MLTCKKIGYFLYVNLGICVFCGTFAQAEVKSVSACHGNTEPACHFITLDCEQGSRIRILTMKYGVKEDKCNNRKNRCLDPNKDGCCTYNTEDCMEYYSDLHAYNLYKDCSGKQTCGPLPVPNRILSSCDSKISTYVHVTYECLPVKNEVKFCRVGNLSNVNGKQLSVVFNKSEESSSTPANCSCFITATQNGEAQIDYVDIRMFKSLTSIQGSSCSSATLTSVPDDNFDTQCVNSKPEEDNFKYGHLTTGTVIEMKLLNLFRNGNDDAPQFVWLHITADDQSNVNVQCFKHANHQTTIPTTLLPPLPSSTPGDHSNTTKMSASGDEGSNTGAIVAGILVPILLLAVIGAVVAFLVWRRRGYLCKKKKKHATPNKYTDSADIDNSVENSEYAEIGFVPDVACMEPNYDQVYEPKNKKASHETNGHTYQNVGKQDQAQGKQPKSTKSPFGKIKTHTDRLISFFRKQTENDFPQVSKRERENSESYDHLRPVSANSSVHVEITPPIDEPNHTYSHTTDDSVRKQVGLNQEKEKPNKNVKASPKIEKRTDVPTEELNAFHVGDAYIEFQFGAVDENHPDLVKCPKEGSNDARPAPPTRPPPSPRTVAKIGTTTTPKASPKQTHQVITPQNEIRSKSTNCLLPSNTIPDDSPSYDYAAGTHVRPRSASPRGSDVSDVSSEHSYKILEKEPEVYDYADVSDDELAKRTDGYTSGSIYEDVDKNLRAESVRKHRSDMSVPVESNEYLEPVTSRTRAISSPIETKEPQESKNDQSKTQHSASSLFKRELKERAQQKKKDKSKPVEGEEKDFSKMVKSDNVDAKDYQKVDKVKGVLNMAKLFDNKDSDSDTSRQSSPRDLQFTNLPSGNKKKSSSNA
ncbi:uncharacterized protein LOC132717134 [Ruditapes philippinarum]|uniref:uncharacterized protein LOC132717134 n=1 Tax=Ruditapes philippinarum TaxID=129788 RepID=UPI00295AF27F|nr:uncharacterized protein LOC132717134 [Ruditapes philippinarum]